MTETQDPHPRYCIEQAASRQDHIWSSQGSQWSSDIPCRSTEDWVRNHIITTWTDIGEAHNQRNFSKSSYPWSTVFAENFSCDISHTDKRRFTLDEYLASRSSLYGQNLDLKAELLSLATQVDATRGSARVFAEQKISGWEGDLAKVFLVVGTMTKAMGQDQWLKNRIAKYQLRIVETSKRSSKPSQKQHMMANQETVSSLLSNIDNIDKSSFDNDASRLEALRKAQALVQRLEKPWESTVRIVWTQNVIMSSIRIAQDLDLFAHLSETPQTHIQLAQKVDCEDALLLRLLRQLAVGGVIEQQNDEDAWVETDWSRALADPDGLINGISYFYDIATHGLTAPPEYLRRTNYRNPVDNARPPNRDWMGSSFWEYFEQRPTVQTSFYKWLGALIPAVPWPSYYPLEMVMEGADHSRPLAVDVGGGIGNEMKALAAASPEASKYQIIVQDLPSVIKRTKTNIEPPIQAVVHDFFQPQPQDLYGARFFFMCSVMHDWPDVECRKILRHIRDAMKPGYSKLLIRENVLPARAVDSGALGGCLDLVMMTSFASKERTEAQWRSLFESVGLRWVRFFPSADGISGVIEVEV
ncbi:hypothetical protein PRZ48_009102 [Zasmidium cellare]|uniref:O-methyltransferase C-terminal domain-containing protein n=1 Tax=Zasmidium cellare TaxID=395010 RepID=A0ABR0EIC3_ZASCE|nr:hypothetical protein PRZ48_009102 [Zasmidium cellare]